MKAIDSFILEKLKLDKNIVLITTMWVSTMTL
jgi:hypothetical protein